MQLKKADRKKAKLRIGLFGTSGSGKTMSALKLAYGLCGDWSKVAVVDTERGSADLYSHLGEYNTLTLTAPFTPERYVQAIETCSHAGMDVVIIDSITHEWNGPGGCLELVEAAKGAVKNEWTAWGKVTPRHNRFIDTILQAPMHIICCSRVKDDVVLEANERGKMEPRKYGLKAVTREGFDYEMTLCFDLSIEHLARTTKDRTSLFMDTIPEVITERTGAKLREWAESGSEPEPVVESAEAEITELSMEIQTAMFAANLSKEDVQKMTGIQSFEGQPVEVYRQVRDLLKAA